MFSSIGLFQFILSYLIQFGYLVYFSFIYFGNMMNENCKNLHLYLLTHFDCNS